MFKYLVVPWHYPTILKPICITGSDNAQEIREIYVCMCLTEDMPFLLT